MPVLQILTACTWLPLGNFCDDHRYVKRRDCHFTLYSYSFYLVPDNEWPRTNLMIGLGLASVIGHIFLFGLAFKGGKGVATLFGMIVAIQPVVAICCRCFLLVLYLTRFVFTVLFCPAFLLLFFILFIFNDDVTLYRVFSVLRHCWSY